MIAILVGILVSGFIFMAMELRNAPQAYQDETGFHAQDQMDRGCTRSQSGALSAMNAGVSS